MKKLAVGGALFLGLAIAGSAHALEVVPYTSLTVTAADATQLGRLTRARPPSTWADVTPFPGVTSPATTFNYRVVNVAFAPNAAQDVFYEITVDDPDALIFASGYLGGYDPTDLSAGYLGDEGSSGNYFPGDPASFQIVVRSGGSLNLVFNTVGTTPADFAYQVSAFSDTMYDEDFATGAVPEPATWAMLVAGFSAVGGTLRQRRRVAAAA